MIGTERAKEEIMEAASYRARRFTFRRREAFGRRHYTGMSLSVIAAGYLYDLEPGEVLALFESLAETPTPPNPPLSDVERIGIRLGDYESERLENVFLVNKQIR